MKKLLLALFVLFSSSALLAQTAEEIIEKSEKAMNIAGLKNFATMIINGGQYIPAYGQEIELKIWLKRPEKIRLETEVMGMSIVQAYNGKKGWAVNPMTGSNDVHTLSEAEIPQLTSIYDIIESPIASLREKEATYELLESETIEDKQYNVIKTTNKEGKSSKLFFDAVSNWFYKVSFTTEGDGEDALIEIIYEERTRAKGVILPKVVEIKANGQTNVVFKFEEYKIDEEINETLFDKL